ncbi:MAG: tetratricopeptide repeat protein [Chitinophagaceae bacterium]|nr:tetratricopeptide repeat protein [Chitinophagaceae bacterium]
MKRWLWFIPLLFCFNSLLAQNATQDSIRAYYKRLSLEKEDTSRAKLLYVLAYYYQFYNLDSSIILARSSYELSKARHFEKGMARASGIMAGGYNKLGNYTRALEYYLEALKILERSKDPDDISRAHLDIAMVYSSKKEYDKALEYAFRSDSIARKNQLNDLLLYIIHNSLDSAIAQKNDLVAGTAYNNLGNIFYKKNQLPQAIEHYNQSVPLLRSVQDDNTLSECYLGMARCYQGLNNLDSSMYYARKAYDLSSGNGYMRHQINASQLLVDLYQKENLIDSAFRYQQTFLSLKDSFDNAEKLKELHNLTMNEDIRQEELAKEAYKLKEERKVKLQLLLIGLLIPLSFLVSAFISKKKVSKRMVELSGIFSLLFLFEYITLLLHPVVAEKSGHSPVIEIVVFVLLAAFLSPAHHKIEHWFVTHLAKRHHHTLHEKKEKGQEGNTNLPDPH